jgi:hypothetical protein
MRQWRHPQEDVFSDSMHEANFQILGDIVSSNLWIQSFCFLCFHSLGKSAGRKVELHFEIPGVDDRNIFCFSTKYIMKSLSERAMLYPLPGSPLRSTADR